MPNRLIWSTEGETSSENTHLPSMRLFPCKARDQQGRVDLFVTDPAKYLLETSELIVCPTCLDEKPLQWAAQLDVAGKDVYFCRCP